MKRSLTAVAALLLLQTLLSLFFSSFSGVFHEIGIILSYLLPLFLFLTPFFRGCLQDKELGFSLKSFFRYLPIFPLFLFGVVAISLATSRIAAFVGYEIKPVNPSESFALSVFYDMLIPAFCEELLFRFAVLRLLAPFGRGGSVMISAILFALLHANLYQMPYAFFAGLLLSSLALASRSVSIPIVFHLLNNMVTVALSYAPSDYILYFYLLVVALLPFSFVLSLKNGAYAECKALLSDKSALPMLKKALLSPLALYALLMLSFTI